MGQKVNPVLIRLGINKEPQAGWFAEGQKFADYLNSDLQIRDFLANKLANAFVSRIQINRHRRNVNITIHTARPGTIIGKKGGDVESLRATLTKMTGAPVHINIEEVRKPELNAKLVAESVAQQLERRVMFRRAMKRAVQNAMRQGAEGIKISLGGRLAGAEIARTEWYHEGRVPLHTFSADIEYACAEAKTTYGIIGVKVWICRGNKRVKHVTAKKD